MRSELAGAGRGRIVPHGIGDRSEIAGFADSPEGRRRAILGTGRTERVRNGQPESLPEAVVGHVVVARSEPRTRRELAVSDEETAPSDPTRP